MTPDQLIAIVGSIFGGLAVGLQIGDLRGQRRAERNSECQRLQTLTAEYLAAIASFQGAVAAHRQAWESRRPKTATLIHAAAAWIGQRDALRGLGAVAPITYSFYLETLHSALLLSAPHARVGSAWAQLKQEEDHHLVAAADTLFEAVNTVAAEPSDSNQARLDGALKIFGGEARRAAVEARLPRWRVWAANRLLRKRRK